MKSLVKGYFKKNLGDDIFLKILLERYKNNNFEVYSSDNYSGVYKTSNIKIYSTKSLLNIVRVILNKIMKILNIKRTFLIEDIKKYDNVILIGGSIFMENTNINYEQYVNKLFNYKLSNYILGANFGPYINEKFIDVHRNNIYPKIKDICFRDKYSYDLFKELSNVRYASDIVFNLDVNNIKKEDNDVAVISVINVTKDNMNYNQDVYNYKMKKLIEFLKNKNMKIILMSFSEIQGDEEIINQIMESLEDKSNIEKYFYRGNIDEALAVLANSKVIFGTRFHANILGLLLGKTVIPIAYSDKTINVFNDMKFNGKIFDIREENKFDISTLKDEDLEYKHDISYQINDAKRQFEALDRIFNKEEM